MENYFNREVLQLERELLRLKTSQQKFAGSVPTAKKSININVPLSLDAGGFTATGKLYCRITVKNGSLVYPTLQKYYDNVMLSPYTESRTRVFTLDMYNDGDNIILEIIATGTNYGQNNDMDTLKNGGSVSLTNTITVVATDNFELEVL